MLLVETAPSVASAVVLELVDSAQLGVDTGTEVSCVLPGHFPTTRALSFACGETLGRSVQLATAAVLVAPLPGWVWITTTLSSTASHMIASVCGVALCWCGAFLGAFARRDEVARFDIWGFGWSGRWYGSDWGICWGGNSWRRGDWGVSGYGCGWGVRGYGCGWGTVGSEFSNPMFVAANAWGETVVLGRASSADCGHRTRLQAVTTEWIVPLNQERARNPLQIDGGT